MFLRFAACNLACTWCDTDFAPEGARRISAAAITDELIASDAHQCRMVVVTGGEPTLQWDELLAGALRAAGFRVHMESNGTHRLAAPVDWLTISPKPQFHQDRWRLLELPASEVKVVVDDTVDEALLAGYEERYRCEHWFVQPCMDDRYREHLDRAIELATRRPRWRLSVQLHKMIGVP